MRIMDLQRTEPQIQWFAESAIAHPGQKTKPHMAVAAGSSGAPAALRLPLTPAPVKPRLQILIEPDAPRDLLIPQETALPQLMVWSARDIAIKKIITAPPQTAAAIDVRPSLDPPNQELERANIRVSASVSAMKTPMLVASTTSPVNVRSAEQAKQIPETASKDSVQITPTSVISLSDVKLQEGPVIVPSINGLSPTVDVGSIMPGPLKSLPQTGHGDTEGMHNGAGTGKAAGNGAGNVATANGVAGQDGANAGAGERAGNNAGSNSKPAVAHITLPKDGRFDVVVVGSSPTEDYPETLDLWSGRLAYTVYLHVGTAKNWILQYSLPRAKEAMPSGNIARTDAPWPYEIMRPSIDADSNTDAIMVHGFVNTAGRFERLAVIFPTELAETQFLLHTLQQWQFRPAMQNGLATLVEVLLIIPDEMQ